MAETNLFKQCKAILKPDNTIAAADIHYSNGAWEVRDISRRPVALPTDYIVPALPVEFHFHGIGHFDFSAMEPNDLPQVNAFMRDAKIYGIPTIFLAYERFGHFLELMDVFAQLKFDGGLPNILGIALEGPMLSSIGGTPQTGNWLPTVAEWEQIAACGEKGLVYVVLSPDFMLQGSLLRGTMTAAHPSLETIVRLLIEAGVRPSLGHFQKQSPRESRRSIEQIIAIAKQIHPMPPAAAPIVTDHLFNDMPRGFTHTWRTAEEKARREQELRESPIQYLRWDNLAEVLGEVPAVLLRGAHDGYIEIALNFDGDHVDLEICKKVVDLLDGRHIICMTDSTQTNRLGEHVLSRSEHNTLWYQQNGIVAAGSQGIYQQIANIARFTAHPSRQWQMASFLALALTGQTPQVRPGDRLKACCYVSRSGEIYPFQAEGV